MQSNVRKIKEDKYISFRSVLPFRYMLICVLDDRLTAVNLKTYVISHTKHSNPMTNLGAILSPES